MTTDGTSRARSITDLAWLAGIVLVIGAALLTPFFRHGFGFGVGPDIPVYLWWTRVGAAEGLSLVGERPGAPALIAILAGTTHLPLAAVTAGFEISFAAAVGTGVGMLVRAAGAMVGERRGERASWVLGGLLAGAFAVHLASGYLSNLAFVATFVTASACLAIGSRRGAVAAAILMGGGGLTHPLFFVTGSLVLVTVAGWAIARPEREGDAGRIAIAVLGGAAVVAAGLASMTIGPARLAVDTSKDGFLRRAGLAEAIRHAYRDRFVHHWARYVQWLALPMAALGLMRTGGLARRLLTAWAALVVIGGPIGLATGWFPADRLITFGFAVPALAGVGVVAVWLWLERRTWLATAVAGALVGLMVAGAMIAWSRQRPFISALEADRATVAGRIAATLPPDTPLVFIVDDDDATASFLATRAANVLRAAMPPERADNVYIYVGTVGDYLAGRPTVRGDEEFDALSRLYLQDIPRDPRAPAVAFVLAPFDRAPGAHGDPGLVRWQRGVFSTAPGPTDLSAAREPLEPSSPARIALAASAILALTGAVGFGWARWAGLDAVASVASAPAFGAATLALTGVALERLGLPLSGSAGPTVATLVAAALGYGIHFAGREPVAPPPPAVEEEPPE